MSDQEPNDFETTEVAGTEGVSMRQIPHNPSEVRNPGAPSGAPEAV